MEYIRNIKLIKVIIKKRKLIKPWKFSKKNVSKRRVTSTGPRRAMERNVDEVMEQDTFLSMEIFEQVRKSQNLHFLRQKKSLKSVIEEAKSELVHRRLELNLRTEDSREDYVELEDVKNTHTRYSDYMDMS